MFLGTSLKGLVVSTLGSLGIFKTRSEMIEWICPTSPHMTMELGWWINRLSEVTSVLAVTRLESVDKMATYEVD